MAVSRRVTGWVTVTGAAGVVGLVLQAVIKTATVIKRAENKPNEKIPTERSFIE